MNIGSFSELQKHSGALHIQVSDQYLKAFGELAAWEPKAASLLPALDRVESWATY